MQNKNGIHAVKEMFILISDSYCEESVHYFHFSDYTENNK